MKRILSYFALLMLLTSTQTFAKKTILTEGFNHIGLTVSNLKASTDFFVETLGWTLQGEDTSYPARYGKHLHLKKPLNSIEKTTLACIILLFQ